VKALTKLVMTKEAVTTTAEEGRAKVAVTC
jgi:hypothetical protein